MKWKKRVALDSWLKLFLSKKFVKKEKNPNFFTLLYREQSSLHFKEINFFFQNMPVNFLSSECFSSRKNRIIPTLPFFPWQPQWLYCRHKEDRQTFLLPLFCLSCAHFRDSKWRIWVFSPNLLFILKTGCFKVQDDQFVCRVFRLFNKFMNMCSRHKDPTDYCEK